MLSHQLSQDLVLGLHLLLLLESYGSVPSSYVLSVILTDERFLHFQLRRDTSTASCDSRTGRIPCIMPLDEVGRRYAESIYQRRLHEISGNEEQEINRLRNQHASRGSVLSGSYIQDHFKVLLERVDILAGEPVSRILCTIFACPRPSATYRKQRAQNCPMMSAVSVLVLLSGFR